MWGSTKIYPLMLVALAASIACAAQSRDTVFYWKARDQFRSDATCPGSDIKQWPRRDIGDAVYDIEGCGKRARFYCMDDLYGHATCTSAPVVGPIAVPSG